LFNVSGIKSDMVLKCGQNNVCDIVIRSDAKIISVKYDKNYATVASAGDNCFEIKGIPVGGPYIVTIEFESAKNENGPTIGYGQVYKNIYVGEID